MLDHAHISYNARYNVMLDSFFINATMIIDKMVYVTPLQSMTSRMLMAVVMVTALFWYNIVFITLIRPCGLSANKGEQGILSEMFNTHTTNTFSCLKCFFFFFAFALLPKCKSVMSPIRHSLSGLLKTIFPIY